MWNALTVIENNQNELEPVKAGLAFFTDIISLIQACPMSVHLYSLFVRS
jgi:hypothetical protein